LILHNAQEIPVPRSRKEGIMKYLKMLMVSMVFLFQVCSVILPSGNKQMKTIGMQNLYMQGQQFCLHLSIREWIRNENHTGSLSLYDLIQNTSSYIIECQSIKK
jgi:hypothetical protein